jgi:hypothetical protein
MSTACSPNSTSEKPVNNSNEPVKSGDFQFTLVNYSPLFQAIKDCGEQVVWV